MARDLAIVAIAITCVSAGAAGEEGDVPPTLGVPLYSAEGPHPVETHTDNVAVTQEATTASRSPGIDHVLVAADVPTLAIVGVTWPGPADTAVTIRLRSLEEGSWTDWSDVEVESDGSLGRGGSAPMTVLDATKIEVELTAPGGALPSDADIHIVDPGRSDADAGVAVGHSIAVSGGHTAPYAQTPTALGIPRVLSRSEWGADETIRTKRPELGRVTGAVVHHTAGANDYTAAQVPAIIRGIYSYHAVNLGWGDIGYNALVDRFGRIWEGRFGGLTQPLVGAHAAGVNSTMFGISLMGDYSTVSVPDVAMQAMAQMTAWKLAVHGVPPDGSAVAADGRPLGQRVIGHRDVSNTVCPGQAFYDRMLEFRDLVEVLYRSMPTYVQHDPHVVRLAGADRFVTSAATSAWIFRRPAVVYVATGFEYADALAASPAAALTGSPVLLVRTHDIPAAVVAELRRIRPAEIRVLGGSAAVSNTTLLQLRKLAGVVEVVGGVDRYETAAALSRRSWSEGARTVYLASGQSAPDSLGAAAAAAKEGAPLLLVRQGELPKATATELARLAPDEIVVVGGEAVVHESVPSEALEVVPGATVSRVGGIDRYATSAMLADRLWDRADSVFYATGVTWPDALSASSAAAEKGSPLLLVKTACAPPLVDGLRATFDPIHAYVVGGTAAVAEGAVARRC